MYIPFVSVLFLLIIVNGHLAAQIGVNVLLAGSHLLTQGKGIQSPLLLVPSGGDGNLLQQRIDARNRVVGLDGNPVQEFSEAIERLLQRVLVLIHILSLIGVMDFVDVIAPGHGRMIIHILLDTNTIGGLIGA